jgi:hypothetical protein
VPADYYIARQVGTQGVLLPVFVGNITTGVGLTNIVASTVGFAWYRNDMAAASTGTCTSGSLGAYSASSWVQVLSTGMRGWYNFGIPNSVFASGSGAAIRLSTAAMEVNVFIELTKTDNQTYFSSQVLSSNQLVNVNQILGSTPVTTAAGVVATAWDLGRTANLTSTISLSGTAIGSVSGLNAALLDASVSSRLAAVGYTAPDNTGIATVSGRLTAARALNLDNLDVSVSSRLAETSYTAPLTAAGTRTAIGLSTASLDARIDTLFPIASYTSPDNAGIAAIQAKTDGLTFTTTGALDANVTHINEKLVTGDGSGTPFDVQ